MELIVINENKLKIIMSADEMQKYGLDENEFHLCASDTRKILKNILHNSPIKTGFEEHSSNERILFQLYPEKRGGCELYVTKLSLERDYIIGDSNMTDRDKETLLPTVYKANEEKKSLLCYRFEGLCDIILSCKALKSRDILCESSIFIDDDRKYYLLLAQGTLNEQSRPFLSVLSEFGELVNAEHSMLNLCERGKRICERNGIETFSAL